MNITRRQRKSITFLFPYLLLIIAALGLALTLVMNRIDLIVISLVMVIPLIVAAVIILCNKNLDMQEIELPDFIGRIHFSHLVLLYLLIFIISLVILISETPRPVIYFVMVSWCSGIILWQILSQRPGWTDKLIMGEIIILSLNLAWGAILKYPLYFSDSDTLIHLTYIDIILRTAHIQTVDVTYQYYSIYHIFNAIGTEISGLPLRTAVFLIMGIAWQAAIVMGFFFFRKLSGSSKLAAISCLFFAMGSQLIFYGSYPIARALAFVFFTGWVYIIMSRVRGNTGFLILSLIMMVAMIMTHHVNVLLMIPVLFLIYVCQLVVNRSHSDRPIEPFYIFLFTVSCLTYFIWAASRMTTQTLPTAILGIMNSDLNVTNNPTQGYGYSTLWGIIYYSFVLLLCFTGANLFLNHLKRNDKFRTAGALALGSFILLVFYVPGPLDLLPLSKNLMSSRLNLLVSPFIAFLTAYGVYYLLNFRLSTGKNLARKYFLPAVGTVTAILITFFSTISVGNALDNNTFPHTSILKTPYFSDSELKSFLFLNEKGLYALPLYADFQTTRNELYLSDFTRFIITGGNISYINNGYLALRIGEMERKKALTFSRDGYGTTSYRYPLDSFNSELSSAVNLGSKNRIYSDGAVQIFVIYNPGNS